MKVASAILIWNKTVEHVLFFEILLLFSILYALHNEQLNNKNIHHHRRLVSFLYSLFFCEFFSIHHGKYFQAINKIFNGFHKDENDFANAIRFDFFPLDFILPMRCQEFILYFL